MINRQISIDDANMRLKARPIQYKRLGASRPAISRRPSIGSIGVLLPNYTDAQKEYFADHRVELMEASLVSLRNRTMSEADITAQLYLIANAMRDRNKSGDLIASFQSTYYAKIQAVVAQITPQTVTGYQVRTVSNGSYDILLNKQTTTKPEFATTTGFLRTSHLEGMVYTNTGATTRLIDNLGNWITIPIFSETLPKPEPGPVPEPVEEEEEEEEEPLFAGDMTMPIIVIGALGIGALFLMMRRK